MKDISARELKGHNILAVERFEDSTRWMIEFVVLHPCSAYGSRDDEMRLFLAEEVSGCPAKPAAPGNQDQALRSCD